LGAMYFDESRFTWKAHARLRSGLRAEAAGLMFVRNHDI